MSAGCALLSCRVTEEGVQTLSALSNLCSFSYGYTSMPEADEVATFIGQQFAALTGKHLCFGTVS